MPLLPLVLATLLLSGATPASPDLSAPSHIAPSHLAPSRLTQPAADSAAVATVIARFHAALEAGDSTSALALLADDVTILESGAVETRAEYRAHHLPADIAYARAIRSQRSAATIRVRGDVAWAASSSVTQGEYKGRAVNAAGAELMVLTRVGSAWKISAIHWSSRARKN